MSIILNYRDNVLQGKIIRTLDTTTTISGGSSFLKESDISGVSPSTVSLISTVTGFNGTPTYQWYYSTSLDSTTWISIPGATSSNYTISSTTFITQKSTGSYVTYRLVSSKEGFISSEDVQSIYYHVNGNTGTPGVTGYRTAILDLYIWSASTPTVFPSGTSIYTWVSASYTEPTTLNSWSKTPTGPTPGWSLYCISLSISDNLSTPTSSILWPVAPTPFVVGVAGVVGSKGDTGDTGVTGNKSMIVSAFKWSNSVIGVVAQAFTYTWDTGVASVFPSGWGGSAGASPAAGYTLYQLNLAFNDVYNATATSLNWSSAVLNTIGYREDGSIGPQGTSSIKAYTVTTSPTPPIGIVAGVGLVAPTGPGIWSFNATSVLTEGQYMYQSDGLLASGGNATWGSAYLSNLKVGSLSALSANLGTVSISSVGSLSSTSKTYGAATAGIFLGYDTSAYKLDVGNSSSYLRWSGTVLEATGITIKNSSGQTIISSGTDPTSLLNSGISINSNGTLNGAGIGTVTIGGLGYTGALNANYTTNTNQLSDGAGLGSTANWSSVSSKPSNIGSLSGAESILNNRDSVITAPGGGIYTTGTPVVYGSLKIRLPTQITGAYPMLRFTVDIYEYATGYSCKLEIGGHTSGPSWHNEFAQVMGGNVEYPVYFGYDIDGYACVWVGTTGTDWSYPQVRVHNVFVGYSSMAVSLWETNWVVSFDTGGPINVTKTVIDTYPAANWAKIPGGYGKPANYATANQSDTVTNNGINAAATTANWNGVADTGGKPANYATANQSDTVTNNGINAAATTANWNGVADTGGRPANYATVGAPSGTYVGGTLAQTVESNASVALANANSALGSKLNKSGADIMTGPISLNAATAILVGDINNGLYLGNTGIVGRKGGGTSFSVDASGNALFAGSLSAATGSFAGSLSAATGSFAGSLSAATGSFVGSLSAATGSFAGSLSAATGSFAGNITASTGALGAISIGSNASIAADGSATFSNVTITRPLSVAIGAISAFNAQYAITKAEGWKKLATTTVDTGVSVGAWWNASDKSYHMTTGVATGTVWLTAYSSDFGAFYANWSVEVTRLFTKSRWQGPTTIHFEVVLWAEVDGQVININFPAPVWNLLKVT